MISESWKFIFTSLKATLSGGKILKFPHCEVGGSRGCVRGQENFSSKINLLPLQLKEMQNNFLCKRIGQKRLSRKYEWHAVPLGFWKQAKIFQTKYGRSSTSQEASKCTQKYLKKLYILRTLDLFTLRKIRVSCLFTFKKGIVQMQIRVRHCLVVHSRHLDATRPHRYWIEVGWVNTHTSRIHSYHLT